MQAQASVVALGRPQDVGLCAQGNIIAAVIEGRGREVGNAYMQMNRPQIHLLQFNDTSLYPLTGSKLFHSDAAEVSSQENLVWK